MRKAQRQQAEELIRQMEEAHDQIKKFIEQGSTLSAAELLEECQNGGITIGTLIEMTEGDGHPTVLLLEEYCELTYQIHEKLTSGCDEEININKIYKLLRQKLIKAENSLKNDIHIRNIAVFLPYKASMWDSLESVWKAADEDEYCDTYVIPIPYFDKNPDGSFREMHDESSQYPAYVPVTRYDTFDFGKHRPDMIFIHNPYDNVNFVTSVHPFFYSENLKKFTDCLVYIPYYSTTGGMAEGQSLCPAYLNADYIVIQSEIYRKFFDSQIPDEKFLALGSPKFDSVIHKCQNPPETPDSWKEKMTGRKVYFYNTSIGGMLADTDMFLKKMRYVFDTFRGRDDVCLLWRPHPLMDSSFDSMRRHYKAQYDALKSEYIDSNIGILDETPDIECSIALSDAYIGDSGTSVTSLFGVAGKPLFILNNYINTLPGKDDWRGEWLIPQFDIWGNDKYMVTKNNQLWISENCDYHYRFYMDLGNEYSGGAYYLKAVEISGRIYVLPWNARHILVIENNKIRKIDFGGDFAKSGAFYDYYYSEKYIFLLPFRYPHLVRFDVDTEQVSYLTGISQFNVRNVNGEWLRGGVAPYGNELAFASPSDNQFVFVDMETLQVRELACNINHSSGTFVVVPENDNLWLLPMKGMAVTCWNPKTGEAAEYSSVPQGFKSVRWPEEIECDEKPFSNISFSQESGKENIVISPSWGNMYLSLDRVSGMMEEWKIPIASAKRGRNGYFVSSYMGGFADMYAAQGKAHHLMWNDPERRLYDVNIDTKEYKEINVEMDYDDLVSHMFGFAVESEWMQYCLNESAIHSLKDFIENKITGSPFDKDRQTRAFEKINANIDGTCGRAVYNTVKGKIV
ncbi:MAG: hypothetical protein K2N73_06060 [Lachnospiraceae bacterium]|nr:hypothetical protein [Lachnospiraceae bacterium]